MMSDYISRVKCSSQSVINLDMHVVGAAAVLTAEKSIVPGEQAVSVFNTIVKSVSTV